jgi:uncharacterized membrane protein
MKTTKIIYWISTALVVLAMIFSSYSDLFDTAVAQAFDHLGFPGYFRIELGVLKIIGIILLLTPLPKVSKEWAYSGFAITFVSAFIAHTASGDPISNRVAPLIILFFLLVSYFSFHRLQNIQKTTIV